MTKNSLINLILGFFLIFVAAASGSFLANDLTIQYLREQSLADEWGSLLRKSAHGHTNLFGVLHICFGLTLPYSSFSEKIKRLQTLGLAMGSFAMSVLMLIRSMIEPKSEQDLLGLLIGACLSFSLAAVFTHMVGLLIKLKMRND